MDLWLQQWWVLFLIPGVSVFVSWCVDLVSGLDSEKR